MEVKWKLVGRIRREKMMGREKSMREERLRRV